MASEAESVTFVACLNCRSEVIRSSPESKVVPEFSITQRKGLALMIDPVRDELEVAARLDPYTGFEQAYVCLVKLSLKEPDSPRFEFLCPAERETRRLLKMVARLPLARMEGILNLPQVDELLNIDPPLETYRSHEKEEMNEDHAREDITTIRSKRNSSSEQALYSLVFLLKTIRNKREHGFKSPKGSRDQEILAPAQVIVVALAEACLKLISLP
jgi:hypothetical protein